MVTICAGWTQPHPEPVVLKPEDGIEAGRVSHGMCPACSRELDAEIRRQEEYAAYRANPTLGIEI